LEPAQQNRLDQIFLQQSGNDSFLRDDIATKLHFTDSQRNRMKAIADEAASSVTALHKEMKDTNDTDTYEKRYKKIRVDEQKKLIAVMKPDQLTNFKKLVGSAFDVTQLGKPAFKAPEIINTSEWINSRPLELKQLRGKVVVLHFYA